MLKTKSGRLDNHIYIIYYDFDDKLGIYYYILDMLHNKKYVYPNIYNYVKYEAYASFDYVSRRLVHCYHQKASRKNCCLYEYKTIENRKYYVFRGDKSYKKDIEYDKNYYDKFFIENELMNKSSDLD